MYARAHGWRKVLSVYLQIGDPDGHLSILTHLNLLEEIVESLRYHTALVV
jgi:hypothetical protein